MAKVKFTHIGILEGCDARTPKNSQGLQKRN